tara:strand:+ start:641 stop:1051 length:411 start_codon:yes stop_codon:yes gene_type:complete
MLESSILISNLLVKFLIPFLLGSLIFFSVIVAPNTFKNLDKINSRKFIRGIFPKLYLWAGNISFIISILIFQINVFHSLLFLLITFGYFFSREYLMKKINLASDKNKQKEFKRLHFISVIIFSSQIILMTIIFLKN